MPMTPSEAYMIGFLRGCQSTNPSMDRDESGLPEKCVAAFQDGFEYGHSRRQLALQEAGYFDTLTEVNKKAWASWNLDGCHPELPDPPPASGCRQHYCMMPVDTKGDNHHCKAHGGKDAPIPKKKR